MKVLQRPLWNEISRFPTTMDRFYGVRSAVGRP
jgi:hypothetical protein